MHKNLTKDGYIHVLTYAIKNTFFCLKQLSPLKYETIFRVTDC